MNIKGCGNSVDFNNSNVQNTYSADRQCWVDNVRTNNKVEGGVNNKKREVVTVEEEVDGKDKEVDNMEELSFTAALEELGGLLDLCPT